MRAAAGRVVSVAADRCGALFDVVDVRGRDTGQRGVALRVEDGREAGPAERLAGAVDVACFARAPLGIEVQRRPVGTRRHFDAVGRSDRVGSEIDRRPGLVDVFVNLRVDVPVGLKQRNESAIGAGAAVHSGMQRLLEVVGRQVELDRASDLQIVRAAHRQPRATRIGLADELELARLPDAAPAGEAGHVGVEGGQVLDCRGDLRQRRRRAEAEDVGIPKRARHLTQRVELPLGREAFGIDREALTARGVVSEELDAVVRCVKARCDCRGHVRLGHHRRPRDGLGVVPGRHDAVAPVVDRLAGVVHGVDAVARTPRRVVHEVAVLVPGGVDRRQRRRRPGTDEGRGIANRFDHPPGVVVLAFGDAAFGIDGVAFAPVFVVGDLRELVARIGERGDRGLDLGVGARDRRQVDVGLRLLPHRPADPPGRAVADGRAALEAVVEERTLLGARDPDIVVQHAVARRRIRAVAIAVQVDPHVVVVRHGARQRHRLPAVGRARAVAQRVDAVVVGIGPAGVAKEHRSADVGFRLESDGGGDHVAGQEAPERARHRAVGARLHPDARRVVVGNAPGEGLGAAQPAFVVVQPLRDRAGGVDRVLEPVVLVVDVARAVRERVAHQDDVAGLVVFVGGGELEPGRIDDLVGAPAGNVVAVLGRPGGGCAGPLDDGEGVCLGIVGGGRAQAQAARHVVDNDVLELALGIERAGRDDALGVGHPHGPALPVVFVGRADVEAGRVDLLREDPVRGVEDILRRHRTAVVRRRRRAVALEPGDDLHQVAVGVVGVLRDVARGIGRRQ